jgi:hypothetical protein
MTTPTTNQSPDIGPNGKFTPELRLMVASLLSMLAIISYTKYFGPEPSVGKNQIAKPAPDVPAPLIQTASATAPIISATAMTSTPRLTRRSEQSSWRTPSIAWNFPIVARW